MNRAIILTNGFLRNSDAKTAHGLIRESERFKIIGVVDCAETAGKDAGEILDGTHRNIPVFESLLSAKKNLTDINFLIVGIATVGGRLPENMLVTITEAIESGISIVNGLHDYLNDKPDIAALALKNKVQLIDIRKPKARKDLSFWSGEVFKLKVPIVAVMGMDCAMGKRTTTRFLKKACISSGLNAQMIYTGQTGWLQGGEYGFIFDSTLNDFVSGELENAIVTCYKETKADIIFLEGQSSLRNPSGPCGSEFLVSGNAKYVVLLFAPKRKYFDDDEHWGRIPSVESEIKLIEGFGAKVIAVAIHTEKCTDEEAFAYQTEYEKKLNIPVLLPLQQGVEKILPILKNLIQKN